MIIICKKVNLADKIKEEAISELIRHELSQNYELFKNEAQKIQKMDLSLSHLESIEGLSIFKKLKYLDLSCNHIENLKELKGLTNLKVLNIVQTDVKDLSPLKNLDNLEILAAAHCDIEDISVLENIDSIEELYLSRTNISDVDQLDILLKLPNLKVVKLSGLPCFMKMPGSFNLKKLKNIPIISKLENQGVQVIFHPNNRYSDSNMPYFSNIPGVAEE